VIEKDTGGEEGTERDGKRKGLVGEKMFEFFGRESGIRETMEKLLVGERK